MKMLSDLTPEHAEYHRKSHEPFCFELCEWNDDPTVQVEMSHRRSLALMEGVEEFKQTVDALVKGLISDGFSDEQARDIVAGFWRGLHRSEGEQS